MRLFQHLFVKKHAFPSPPTECVLPDAAAYYAIQEDPDINSILRDSEEELGKLECRQDCPDRSIWKEWAMSSAPLPQDLAEHKANCDVCYLTFAAFTAAPQAERMSKELVALLKESENK